MNKFFIVICLISFLFTSSSWAVPTSSTKESAVPVLFSAIQKEDLELYSDTMRKLLYGSMKEFSAMIQFKTSEGDTIFHLMAGIRSHHQSFFAREMQSLIDAFSQKNLSELSLGGVTISIPHLEDIDLGKAVKNMNTSAILTIANRLDESSAIEWFQNLHAKTRNGLSLKSFAFKSLDINQLLYLRDTGIEQKIERYTQASSLLLTKNKKGLSPKDIAYQSENHPAYAFISDYVESQRDFTLKDGLVVGVGGLGFIATVFLFFTSDLLWPYQLSSAPEPEVSLYKMFSATAYGGLGATVGGLTTAKCYNVFRRMKLNRIKNRSKKLRKNNNI